MNSALPRQWNKKAGLALAIIVAAGLSACSTERQEVGFDVPDRESDLAFVTPGANGDERDAFDFVAPELFTGQPVDGSDLYIDSPTIITFVDPNCPVCLAEGPDLAEAAAEHSSINFVVIHGFANADAYAGFVERSGLHVENVLHLVDADGTLSNRFEILFQPASLFVDSGGAVTIANGSLGVAGINEAVSIISDDS